MSIELHFGGKNPGRPDEVWIDHETGLIHIPGKAPEPMIGQTAGRAYELAKETELATRVEMQALKRQMLSRYQCTECKQKFWGSQARLRLRLVDGVEAPVLTCPNVKCDGPAVLIQDAADIRKMPTEG